MHERFTGALTHKVVSAHQHCPRELRFAQWSVK